ncbi:MAG: 6-phosphogluconolactonase [Gammaproteobacteria bacterium]|nr:6-phosphogluconolactonase [Gammaproteobacteria bacterium]
MAGKRMIVKAAEFTDAAVDWIVSTIHKVLDERQVCHLMLAGGGTPLPVYGALTKKKLPWDDLRLYFGDERCVPPSHSESNYRAVTQALFPQGIPENLQLYRMRGEDDPETAARDYAVILPDRLDILLLGMGGDGHTASLFPDSPALHTKDRLVLPVIGSKPPPQRLTITPAVIRNARYLLVLVEGENKAEAVYRALEVGDVPVALARHGDWLIDQAAASALSDL